MTTRAAIYIRVSVSRNEDDEVSLDVQEQAGRNYCSVRGWDVVDVYSDRGISGFKDVERPQYERLLTDVAAGRVDAIVVFKIDRFARSIREFVRYIQVFKEYGTVFASVNDSVDTSTATGRAILGVITIFAELESENTSLRRRAMTRERAERGQVTKGGRRPFGYKADRVTLDPKEVVLIREAAARFSDGESLRSIAMDWNERKIVTTTGGLWSGHTVGQTLRSPRLAGYRVHLGTAYKSDVIEAVFSEDEHVQLSAALGDAKRRAPRKTMARHLLSSLLFCSVCGASMKIRNEQSKVGDDGQRKPATLRYACIKREDAPNCGSVTILATKTEAQVFEDVVSFIDSEGLRDVADGQDVSILLAATEEALREDQARLEQLSRDHYVGGDGFRLSRDEYVAARVPLSARVAQLEVEVAGLRRRVAVGRPSVPQDPTALRAWWSEADLLDKRAFLDVVLERIDVAPVRRRGHNTYDPDRLSYVWRR